MVSPAKVQQCHSDCGCEVSDCCLTCPLPVCRYDDPHGQGGYRARRERRAAIVAYFHALKLGTRPARVQATATEFSVTRRSVYRMILKEDE